MLWWLTMVSLQKFQFFGQLRPLEDHAVHLPTSICNSTAKQNTWISPVDPYKYSSKKENQSKIIDSLAQDPQRCQSFPNALHPSHKICNNNNNILEGGMGGLLLKLLKITCCDCILQPLRAQSEDTSSSSCLSWCPCTCTSSLSTSEHPESCSAPKAMQGGTFSTRAQGVSPGWDTGTVLHKPNLQGGAAGGKKEREQR